MQYLWKRGDRYYYRRRVPSEVAHLDRRGVIKISLKTKNEKEAYRRVEIYHEKMEEFWQALLISGEVVGLEEKYHAAVKVARAHGFAYKTAEEIAAGPLSEIIDRLSVPIENEVTARALTGTAEVPEITLQKVKEEYFEIAVDQISGKSARRIHKWKVDRTRAIENLIEVAGNKAINRLTREDIGKFMEFWREKIRNGQSGDTANRQIRYTREMITAVARKHNISIPAEYEEYKGIAALYAGMRFKVALKQRAPFEPSFVQEKIIPALAGLHDEDVRLVIMAMADTGARNHEIISAKPEHIRLGDTIPHLYIEGSKTRTSRRVIPLVGTALYAFQQRPDGFGERWGNPDSFSNLANAWLRENGLLPTDNHFVYSLRHTFKDRLRNVEAPEEMIDQLMGHETNKPSYGGGYSLEKKLKWMEKIAFKIQP